MKEECQTILAQVGNPPPAGATYVRSGPRMRKALATGAFLRASHGADHSCRAGRLEPSFVGEQLKMVKLRDGQKIEYGSLQFYIGDRRSAKSGKS